LRVLITLWIMLQKRNLTLIRFMGTFSIGAHRAFLWVDAIQGVLLVYGDGSTER
jgi:hypothetical protein